MSTSLQVIMVADCEAVTPFNILPPGVAPDC